MKISIITPSFNQSKYLPTCIRSVLMQSYQDIEHIIVDGCSTDKSVEILEVFKKNDSRLSYISEVDSGQGDAVNKGFKMANGDIIAWLNSDDFYYDKNVFKFIIDFFAENPTVDIVYGGMVYVNDANEVEHIRIPPSFDARLLTMISYIGNTNCFYRRSVIEKNLLDVDYHFVIDHEFMLRITKDFFAVRVKRLLGCFRVHDEAKTQTMSEKSKNLERIRRDLAHGINRNLSFQIYQILMRMVYKIQLKYTDFLLLKMIMKNPGFSPFLRSNEE